jgi:crotonobetainyl-CoA:carnitine CoA-transferase CaiB-like acyl-CoA transferase
VAAGRRKRPLTLPRMRLGEVVPGEGADQGKPLDGVRVLAAEQMQALPYATQLLGRLGAEVVKVEHPRDGDSGRGAKPSLVDVDGREVGATYLRNNLNKRSIAIDLKHPEGAALVRRLAGRFDVFAENMKPGSVERLGLGWEALSGLHPRLVYVSVSGFGNLGATPWAGRPAYSSVVEAMAGLYELMREPGDPTRVGSAGALGDLGASLFAVIGALAALHERERSGRGRRVDVAMYDAVVALLDLVPFFWSMGIPRLRRGAVTGVFDVFACRDGRFVAQAVREHQLRRFAEVVGHPEWKDDPRLASREGWTEHLEALVRPGVEAWARERGIAEVVAALAGAGIPCGPSQTPDQLVRDPHLREREMLLEVARPDGGAPLLVAGNPVKLAGAGPTPRQRWPVLGAHTDAVLAAELGLAPPELARLRAAGAIGGGPR